MNEDQARIVRIYQYLLAKDVSIKRTIGQLEKSVRRRNPFPDEVFDYWYSLIKAEIWQEIANELWHLLK